MERITKQIRACYSLSPGERVRVRASQNSVLFSIFILYSAAWPIANAPANCARKKPRNSGESSPSPPALSPRERENRRPSFGDQARSCNEVRQNGAGAEWKELRSKYAHAIPSPWG